MTGWHVLSKFITAVIDDLDAQTVTNYYLSRPSSFQTGFWVFFNAVS